MEPKAKRGWIWAIVIIALVALAIWYGMKGKTTPGEENNATTTPSTLNSSPDAEAAKMAADLEASLSADMNADFTDLDASIKNF